MSIETWNLYSKIQPRQSAVADALPEKVRTDRGDFKFDWQTITHGPGAGVELLTVSGARAGFILIPTRGMGIWMAWCDGVEFGWNSPISGPIHPAYVPINDATGIGWLEGFDELLCRCGLESNGAPEFTKQGQVRWPLHGRVANLPAQNLRVSIDTQTGELEVIGVVRESRLFFANLELQSTLKFRVDDCVLRIEDCVSNRSARPATHQLLYHINVSKPIVGAGGRLEVSASDVAPRNKRAQESIDAWDVNQSPEVGYAEQVYFFKPNADASGWARAGVFAPDRQSCMGVTYNTKTLPCFTHWRNTAAEADGYVVGLEPATNFPNSRSFEEKHGRVVQLPPGESVTHQLELHLLASALEAAKFSDEIKALGSQPKIHPEPLKDWSSD